MGITDKVTGRVKKAAGDLVDDPGLKSEGTVEERKAEKKEELARDEARAEEAKQRAEQKADEVDRLDRAS
jgi:uncharacterized protein YjbJ (UPF0337 family)